MSAADQIAKLDRFIAARGESVTLQRITGKIPNQSISELPITAHVHAFGVDEVVGNVKTKDQKVIISPTGLSWPEIKDTDKIVVAGKVCTIVSALPMRLGGTVIRWDLHITG